MTMLLVVTSAVSIITTTIVNLFQEDKTAYIFDSTTAVALHMAEEANATLSNYMTQMNVLARALLSDEIVQKEVFIKSLFDDFDDVMAVTLYDLDGTERVTLYDTALLREADIKIEDIVQYRKEHPLPIASLGEATYIQNSTLSSKLPSFTLAFLYQQTEKAGIISAEIHLNKLLALVDKSNVFVTFLVDRRGALFSHPDLGRVLARQDLSSIPIVAEFLKETAFAQTLEYSMEDETFLGAYARIDFGQLGAIVQTPKGVAYLTARELINTLLMVSLGVLFVSALASLFWSRRMTRPIQKLSDATRAVASGNFNIQVEVGGRDELRSLSDSFNQMASELQKREGALKAAQSALIQSEKMAAFGQLGAGIAHEVKNPLAGIMGYAQLAQRKIDPESPVARHLAIIEKETKRCKVIIENLLRFARQEKTAFMPTDLNRVILDAVTIVDHQLTLNHVKIERTLSETLPKVNGNDNQLQQVCINLMINAQQAMPEGGTVHLTTRAIPPYVEIRVSDTGIGIPKENLKKIFEPFFTTKPVGTGTGLGLSVSYGLIKDHSGQILVESEEGKGTTFTLLIPEA
jgi:signal transduction histidine kinase